VSISNKIKSSFHKLTMEQKRYILFLFDVVKLQNWNKTDLDKINCMLEKHEDMVFYQRVAQKEGGASISSTGSRNNVLFCWRKKEYTNFLNIAIKNQLGFLNPSYSLIDGKHVFVVPINKYIDAYHIFNFCNSNKITMCQDLTRKISSFTESKKEKQNIALNNPLHEEKDIYSYSLANAKLKKHQPAAVTFFINNKKIINGNRS